MLRSFCSVLTISDSALGHIGHGGRLEVHGVKVAIWSFEQRQIRPGHNRNGFGEKQNKCFHESRSVSMIDAVMHYLGISKQVEVIKVQTAVPAADVRAAMLAEGASVFPSYAILTSRRSNRPAPWRRVEKHQHLQQCREEGQENDVWPSLGRF